MPSNGCVPGTPTTSTPCSATSTTTCVFTSPVRRRVLPETGGVVRGKPALRDYWATALQTLPDLHFDIVGVYRGESALVINYRNQRGGLVNEVLIFDADGLVREGHGTYLEE